MGHSLHSCSLRLEDQRTGRETHVHEHHHELRIGAGRSILTSTVVDPDHEYPEDRQDGEEERGHVEGRWDTSGETGASQEEREVPQPPTEPDD